MDVLAAVTILAGRKEAELQAMLPEDARPQCDGVSDGIACLSFVVAGCLLSGQLPDCRDFDDLVSAWRHFRSLWDGGVIGDDQWSEAATSVFQDIELDALRTANAIGQSLYQPTRRRFSRAELN